MTKIKSVTKLYGVRWNTFFLAQDNYPLIPILHHKILTNSTNWENKQVWGKALLLIYSQDSHYFHIFFSNRIYEF